MTTPVRIAVAVVVIAASGFAAYAFASRANVGTKPSATPTATNLNENLLGEPLPAARYRANMDSAVARTLSDWSPVQFDLYVTLPSGWVMQDLSLSDVSFNSATHAFIGFFTVLDVYKDPCHPEAGFAGEGWPPADSELESDLRSMTGFEAGPVTSVTIGGRAARHFTVSNNIDTSAAACTDGALLPLFATLDSPSRQAELRNRAHSPATNGGTTREIWIVNQDSGQGGTIRPLLIVAETGSDDPVTARARIESILSSVGLSSYQD
jgi:hypothetical protein